LKNDGDNLCRSMKNCGEFFGLLQHSCN